MKIMVFLHGTVIMHRDAVGRPREERGRQVRNGEVSVRDFASYVPVGDAVRKLRAWRQQRAIIVYLSSHRNAADIEKDSSVLKAHGFPEGEILFRSGDEEYKDIAERELPEILIEDDCESIGGEPQMIYPHIRPELARRIKSIVVKEFGGIDPLADDVVALGALIQPER